MVGDRYWIKPSSDNGRRFAALANNTIGSAVTMPEPINKEVTKGLLEPNIPVSCECRNNRYMSASGVISRVSSVMPVMGAMPSSFLHNPYSEKLVASDSATQGTLPN